MSNLANYYQRKKTTFIYLDNDTEIQALAQKLKKEKKAFFTTEGRDKIKSIWESKKYGYIVWTYRTNQEERWVVIVLDTKKKEATIHSTSQSTPAQKELDEVTGFLLLLPELTNAKSPNLDVDTKNRTAEESSLVAILYVLKILKSIERGNYTSKIDTSDFTDKESDGKTKLEKVKEKYDKLVAELAKIPKLEVALKSPWSIPKTEEEIKKELEKLLKDTKEKWTDYLSKKGSDDILIRLFASFRDTANELLPLIENCLKSKQDLTDYQKLDQEWGKGGIYNNSRDYLNVWYTLRLFIREWESLSKKPLTTSLLTDLDQQKIAEYESLKKGLELNEKEKEELKKQIENKEKDNRILKKWKTPEAESDLNKEIQQKIIDAYNTEEFLLDYHKKLLTNFLDWEYMGNEKQRTASKKNKAGLNKCLKFLAVK